MNRTDKPSWLKVSYNYANTREVYELLGKLKLNTVCQAANCPNLGECYQKRTATFMILGSHCTRDCRFCDVICGPPETVDPQEPQNVAAAVRELGLLHAVITSVTRDDLADGGAAHFAAVIRAIRESSPDATVEVLIPDFLGDEAALNTVLEAGPDVLNHNVETVAELYDRVRPQAIYQRSLDLLQRTADYARAHGSDTPLVKTGVMLGLGETDEQLKRLFADLVNHSCEILTLGQYLQPSPSHVPLARYVSPEEFERYREMAEQAGIAYVAASPLVRSSYRAGEAIRQVLRRKTDTERQSCSGSE